MKFPRLDVTLLRGKAHYFFYFSGTAGVLPFLQVIAKQMGVSVEGVGVLYTVLPFVALVSKPIMSGLADKLRKKKCMLMIALLTIMICLFSINFIPDITEQSPITKPEVELSASIECSSKHGNWFSFCEANSTEILKEGHQLRCSVNCPVDVQLPCTDLATCNDSVSSSNDTNSRMVLLQTSLQTNKLLNFAENDGCVNIPPTDLSALSGNYSLTDCPTGDVLFKTCSLECNFTNYQTDVLTETQEVQSVYTSYQFWWLSCSLVVTYIAMGLVVSVSDAVVYDLLGSERRNEFGLQRLWGTIGWGAINILAGFFNRLASTGQTRQDYSPGFYMFILFMGVDLLVMSSMRVVSESKPPANIVGNVGKLLLRPRVVVFMMSVYCVGVLTGVLESFLFWYLTDLGADSLQLGLTRGVQCFGGELLSFIISGYVIRKIGHVNAMTLVFAAFGVRFISYSFLTDPWYTLPIEFTHGITFGIYYATITSYASILAPIGMSATLQGLVGGINEGAGMATGSLLGGLLYGRFGGRLTFLSYGLGAVSCCLLHAAFQFFGRRWLHPQEQEISAVQANAEDVKMLPDNHIPLEPVAEG